MHSVQMFVPRCRLVAQATSNLFLSNVNCIEKDWNLAAESTDSAIDAAVGLQISQRFEDCENVLENPAMLHLAHLFCAWGD